MKLIKKTLLAASVASAFAFPLSASADVIGQSVLEVSDFLIIGADGSPLEFGGAGNDFAALVFEDSTDASATLNGVNQQDSDNTGTFAGLDLAQQCVGDCSFGENDYSHHAAATETTARADTLLTGAPITVGAVPATGAVASTLAEVQINDGSIDGSSSSNLGLISTFSFILGNSQAITFEFDADVWLYTALSGNTIIPGSNAQARVAWGIEISNSGTGATVFEWNPDGTAGGITGGTENSDDCDLTRNIASQLPGTSANYACSGFFSATTGVLAAGTAYTLNLSHVTLADAQQTVPEPATLVLAGLGLLGLGATRRRKQK